MVGRGYQGREVGRGYQGREGVDVEELLLLRV